MTSKNPSQDSSSPPRRILVVEDDLDILEAMQLILKSRGFEVVGLDQSSMVEECLQTFQPDLILLDIWMSGGDGRDLARWLRQQEETKQIPIVIVSANMATQQIAKEVRADDFILKPFDVDHLVAVVTKRLRKAGSNDFYRQNSGRAAQERRGKQKTGSE